MDSEVAQHIDAIGEALVALGKEQAEAPKRLGQVLEQVVRLAQMQQLLLQRIITLESHVFGPQKPQGELS